MAKFTIRYKGKEYTNFTKEQFADKFISYLLLYCRHQNLDREKTYNEFWELAKVKKVVMWTDLDATFIADFKD